MERNRSSSDEGLQAALQGGKIELHGQFLLGSNYTFLVDLHHAGRTFQAVYKPMRGEQPLWDFPEASLAGREVAAWLVSEALGFHFVPLTLLRPDGPFGPGSLQQFIEYNPNRHYFSFAPAERQRLRPVAAFDLLVNNADRKGSHVLFQKRTRRLFAIDHGLCFHAEDKLRTVIWDFAGERLAGDLLSRLQAAFHAPRWTGSLRPALEPYLNPDELAALAARAAALLDNPHFPHPPADRRAFPYPPL